MYSCKNSHCQQEQLISLKHRRMNWQQQRSSPISTNRKSALSVVTIETADRRVRSESVGTGQYSVSCVSERSETYGPRWLLPVRSYVWFYFLLYYLQFLFILQLSKNAKVRFDFKLIFQFQKLFNELFGYMQFYLTSYVFS